MLRKFLLFFISSLLFLNASPSFAGDDWGWYRGNIYHPKEYVMNFENEGFVYTGCEYPSASQSNWKLQIKSGNSKNSKYKTVAVGTIVTRLDRPSMQKYGASLICGNPSYPYVLVFEWAPFDWQKDYKARIMKDKSVDDTFTILIHPSLKKTKPIIQY